MEGSAKPSSFFYLKPYHVTWEANTNIPKIYASKTPISLFIESLLSNFDGGQKKLSLVIKIHSFTDLQNHQKTQIPR